MARIAVITTLAAAGPRVQDSRAPPTKWPLVPAPTGKLIICAAKTNAPITPSSGAFNSSKPRCARRATNPTTGAATASNAAHTGVDRNPSGMCTIDSKVARNEESCHRHFAKFQVLTCVPMSGLSRIGAAINTDLLTKFDKLIGQRGYTNRSEAFRDLIRDELV